jgi:hypothetical protein
MQRALLTCHVGRTHSYFDRLKSSWFSFASPFKPPEKKNPHPRRLLQKKRKKKAGPVELSIGHCWTFSFPGTWNQWVLVGYMYALG